MKKILLIGDIVGYGRVAITPMLSILSHMNLQVSTLPTAVISNTFDYGIVEVADMTEYMNKTVDVWKKLNLCFDIIVTGFINNAEQVDIIHRLIRRQPEKPMIISDPIMGDDGALYHGLNPEIISYMSQLIEYSDYIIPNHTELALLSGEEYREDSSEQILQKQIQKINRQGKCSVITTSTVLNGKNCIYAYDTMRSQFFDLPYQHIPYKFAGTGDIFTAILTGYLANGRDLETALPQVAKVLSNILEAEKNTSSEKVKNVAIERHFNLL